MPKKMSDKQIAANQANAAKSTGPKTSKGKGVSKMNSLKHGILSKQVLVQGMFRQESERELKALHRRFWDDLKPVGPLEEMLVDQIVTTHWRLRRALTAEAGEIAMGVDGGQWRRDRGPNPLMQWMQWETAADPIWAMEDSSEGNYMIESWLKTLRGRVEHDGELTSEGVEKLGHKANSLRGELERFRLKLQENPEGLDASALRATNKERALKYLDDRLSRIARQFDECVRRECQTNKARQAAAVLPSEAVLDKILRYETKLEKQMHRAMLQLERLQRRRQGEDVPAPYSVEVSERVSE